MNNIVLFGIHLNGLEFVTYVIIPLAMILVVLVYLISNFYLIKVSLNSDSKFMDDLEDTIVKK